MKKKIKRFVLLAVVGLSAASCTMYEDTDVEIVPPPQVTDTVSLEPWTTGCHTTDVGH